MEHKKRPPKVPEIKFDKTRSIIIRNFLPQTRKQDYFLVFLVGVTLVSISGYSISYYYSANDLNLAQEESTVHNERNPASSMHNNNLQNKMPEAVVQPNEVIQNQYEEYADDEDDRLVEEEENELAEEEFKTQAQNPPGIMVQEVNEETMAEGVILKPVNDSGEQ
jgi:hypothetical protein